ncbi:hypothetical protein AU106_gp238 [Sinorhizobium phage phiM9]|uniref:Uncharacterized protein n=1 Tax=Sinorhizobium phage phiM9 TaxID=1636182 RepID=A0A0F6THM9_9CAUD|nr:hypothetical protein AU106_gp238 [Sinorhizobium phage phiM9]AKE44869.1 hypothetical protein Sm_phiM9_242 [Sinorhizobium phage phiM9]
MSLTVQKDREGFFNIDNAKSYKTEANLMKALEKIGINDQEDVFMVVCNREGRFTALFSARSPRLRDGGYIGVYSQFGFKTF